MEIFKSGGGRSSIWLTSSDTDDYLTVARPSDKGERMIKTLIRHSVVPAISSQLEQTLSAKDTYNQIMKMFHFPSRTTQMNLLQDIINQRLDGWSKDSIPGVCYQLGLPASGDVEFSTYSKRVLGNNPTIPSRHARLRQQSELRRTTYIRATHPRYPTSRHCMSHLHTTHPIAARGLHQLVAYRTRAARLSVSRPRHERPHEPRISQHAHQRPLDLVTRPRPGFRHLLDAGVPTWLSLQWVGPLGCRLSTQSGPSNHRGPCPPCCSLVGVRRPVAYRHLV